MRQHKYGMGQYIGQHVYGTTHTWENIWYNKYGQQLHGIMPKNACEGNSVLCLTQLLLPEIAACLESSPWNGFTSKVVRETDLPVDNVISMCEYRLCQNFAQLELFYRTGFLWFTLRGDYCIWSDKPEFWGPYDYPWKFGQKGREETAIPLINIMRLILRPCDRFRSELADSQAAILLYFSIWRRRSLLGLFRGYGSILFTK